MSQFDWPITPQKKIMQATQNRRFYFEVQSSSPLAHLYRWKEAEFMGAVYKSFFQLPRPLLKMLHYFFRLKKQDLEAFHFFFNFLHQKQVFELVEYICKGQIFILPALKVLISKPNQWRVVCLFTEGQHVTLFRQDGPTGDKELMILTKK
jgi:hypothetical protein